MKSWFAHSSNYVSLAMMISEQLSAYSGKTSKILLSSARAYEMHRALASYTEGLDFSVTCELISSICVLKAMLMKMD